MAVRKPAAAPAKQKLRKNHGPKRKMFHCWDSTMRLAFGKAGLLTKYNNYESFALSCTTRGIRTDLSDLWETFIRLPNMDAKKEFLKNLKENASKVAQAKARKAEKNNK